MDLASFRRCVIMLTSVIPKIGAQFSKTISFVLRYGAICAKIINIKIRIFIKPFPQSFFGDNLRGVRNSAVECYLHMVEVAGSNPAGPISARN